MDYYHVLGLRNDASPEQIQFAYIELSEKFGPHAQSDLSSDARAKAYKDLIDAYETLADENKRMAYDKKLKENKSAANDIRAIWTKATQSVTNSDKTSLTQPGVHSQGQSGANTSLATDASQPKIQALVLEMQIDVSLKEAIKGAKRSITINDPTPCRECVGMKPVNRMQCPTCRGVGSFNVERKEDIVVPGGLYENMEIRRPGQGRFDIRANKKGDLLLRIKLMHHPLLSVVDKDLTCTVPVTLYEAILGAEIEVPSATGKIVMKIQPLTHPNRVYRLKGMGLAGGDQLVTIDVVIPKQLSAEEANMYRKLKELSKEPNPRVAYLSKLQS